MIKKEEKNYKRKIRAQETERKGIEIEDLKDLKENLFVKNYYKNRHKKLSL